MFRNYPAQGRRYIAERLQQEGWFDEEDWDVSDWFLDARDPEVAGKTVKVGGGRKWSQEAWQKAHAAWVKHGRDNHLVFESQAQEQRVRDRAERWRNRYPNAAPTGVREDALSEEDRLNLRGAHFLQEYNFYRHLSNFAHHLNRSLVESLPETIACRKLFDRADRLNLAGEPLQALNLYRKRVKEEPDPLDPKKTRLLWGGKDLSPLEAWRDLILMRNKEYRRDSFTQEQSAEIQIRYLILFNRQDGLDMKRRLVKAAGLLPLVPKVTPESFRPPIVEGPFDGTDDEGEPLVPDQIMDQSMQRMHLPTRRLPPMTRPEDMRPPTAPGGQPLRPPPGVDVTPN
jgi:hypothetical protein